MDSGGAVFTMMFTAQTPQGRITWLSDADDPLFGSPVVALRLRIATETGLNPSVTGETYFPDLSDPKDVVWALESIYGLDVTFDENAPEPTDVYGPDIPGAVY